MHLPILSWPIYRAREWVGILVDRGVSVSPAEPMLGLPSEMRYNGIDISPLGEAELAPVVSVKCRRGQAEVTLIGAVDENFEHKQYLISFCWNSGWKGSKSPNSLLASEIQQLLMNAGATTYDPWNEGPEHRGDPR